MLNSEFNEFATNPDIDLYPMELREKINEMNAYVYDNINNGVYKCGFAKSQEAYEGNFINLFNALDSIEETLRKSRYLVGDRTITLADIRLFTTLLRFDMVYVGHFKCNLKTISNGYPNIWGFTREIYQYPGVINTCKVNHIKFHYYYSHTNINPTRVVPVGPQLDFESPHGRTEISTL